MEYIERIKNSNFEQLVEQEKYREAINCMVEEVKFNYLTIQDKAKEEIKEIYESILIYGEELQIDSRIDNRLFEFIKFRRDIFVDLFIKTVRSLK